MPELQKWSVVSCQTFEMGRCFAGMLHLLDMSEQICYYFMPKSLFCIMLGVTEQHFFSLDCYVNHWQCHEGHPDKTIFLLQNTAILHERPSPLVAEHTALQCFVLVDILCASRCCSGCS